jgi:hypothetical protein
MHDGWNEKGMLFGIILRILAKNIVHYEMQYVYMQFIA